MQNSIDKQQKVAKIAIRKRNTLRFAPFTPNSNKLLDCSQSGSLSCYPPLIAALGVKTERSRTN